MKLLICTQAVDAEDPILGFFIRWIEELAKQYEQVEVVCLKEGKHALPANIHVSSLGKPASRLHYVLRFYRYIFSLQYDAVFVHMNQEYVLLGGLFWRFWGERVSLWRNHAKGTISTYLAVLLSHKVFYTSRQSYTARFQKALQMPAGIDTDFFRPDALVHKKPNTILFLGRIAPVKKAGEFVEALGELQELGTEFSATIAGSVSVKDAAYEKQLRRIVSDHNLSASVQFAGPVTQKQALALYQQHELYVNLTPSGSMDKTIFEALACDVTPLVYNHDLTEVLGSDLTLANLDASEVAQKMKRALTDKKLDFRNFVTEHHSLKKLVAALKNEL